MPFTFCILALHGATADVAEFLQWSRPAISPAGSAKESLTGTHCLRATPAGRLSDAFQDLTERPVVSLQKNQHFVAFRFRATGETVPFARIQALATRFEDLDFEFSYLAPVSRRAGQVLYVGGEVVDHYLPDDETDYIEFVETMFGSPALPDPDPVDEGRAR